MLYRDQSSGVAVLAPAKLNLFLAVLGQRPDGYHDLETLMVSVGLYDTLRIVPCESEAVVLRCFDAAPPGVTSPREPIPAGGDNLVLKAAALLRQKTGCRRGAQIELFKRIPMSAGLAGGSSDAAAALVGLNRLWDLRLSRSELHELAAQLGSDVPFFLCPTAAALCRGRGEIVEPLRMPLRLHFVIARPRTGLSTAEVFRHCRPARPPWTAAELAECLAQGRLDRAAKRFFNSLQEPAERLNSDVTRLAGAMAREPFAGRLMSGSGTSCFGLCRSRREAIGLAARLRAKRLGDVFVTSSRP